MLTSFAVVNVKRNRVSVVCIVLQLFCSYCLIKVHVIYYVECFVLLQRDVCAVIRCVFFVVFSFATTTATTTNSTCCSSLVVPHYDTSIT